MDVTKPFKFIGFGAMDVTKPYTFIGFGAMDVIPSPLPLPSWRPFTQAQCDAPFLRRERRTPSAPMYAVAIFSERKPDTSRCLRMAAPLTVITAAQMLATQPREIRVSHITLRETEKYLGIYMNLHIDQAGLHVRGHFGDASGIQYVMQGTYVRTYIHACTASLRQGPGHPSRPWTESNTT